MSPEESDILVSPGTTGYSSVVRMDLYFKGQEFPIAQMGGDTITLREPFGEGSGEGEVVLTIDGVPRRWLVNIRNQPFPTRTITADFRDPD
jgi:hypothetical protein